MVNPASQMEATRQAKALLVRTLPGSRRGSVRAHLQRSGYIAEAIWRRWQVGPYRWQIKHLRWYLVTQTVQYKPGTRYRHWLTVRALIHALGKQDHWLPHLPGPWLRPTGETGRLMAGRPPKLPS